MIIGEVYGCFEENDGNTYWTFTSADKNKEVLKKYTKFWDEIKYLIITINSGKEGECKKRFHKR